MRPALPCLTHSLTHLSLARNVRLRSDGQTQVDEQTGLFLDRTMPIRRSSLLLHTSE